MTDRRSALKTLVAPAAAVVAAACESAVARLKGKKLVAVASVDQLASGAAVRLTIGEQPIIVVTDAGKIRTFLAVCTHEGCPLGWNPTQHLIRCPCHGSAFNTTGAVVNGPALMPLTEIETIVERGRVFVVDPQRNTAG